MELVATGDFALFDAVELMEQLGDDPELLQDIVDILQDDAPKRLDDLRRAYAAADAYTLERTAHGLKGAVGVFYATTAVNAASRLEQLGRAGNVRDAGPALGDLERAVNALLPALSRLARRLTLQSA